MRTGLLVVGGFDRQTAGLPFARCGCRASYGIDANDGFLAGKNPQNPENDPAKASKPKYCDPLRPFVWIAPTAGTQSSAYNGS